LGGREGAEAASFISPIVQIDELRGSDENSADADGDDDPWRQVAAFGGAREYEGDEERTRHMAHEFPSGRWEIRPEAPDRSVDDQQGPGDRRENDGPMTGLAAQSPKEVNGYSKAANCVQQTDRVSIALEIDTSEEKIAANGPTQRAKKRNERENDIQRYDNDHLRCTQDAMNCPVDIRCHGFGRVAQRGLTGADTHLIQSFN
jgi:hypothetical protein